MRAQLREQELIDCVYNGGKQIVDSSKFTYRLMGSDLGVTNLGRNLGVVSSGPCVVVVTKAHSVLNFNKKATMMTPLIHM